MASPQGKSSTGHLQYQLHLLPSLYFLLSLVLFSNLSTTQAKVFPSVTGVASTDLFFCTDFRHLKTAKDMKIAQISHHNITTQSDYHFKSMLGDLKRGTFINVPRVVSPMTLSIKSHLMLLLTTTKNNLTEAVRQTNIPTPGYYASALGITQTQIVTFLHELYNASISRTTRAKRDTSHVSAANSLQALLPGWDFNLLQKLRLKVHTEMYVNGLVNESSPSWLCDYLELTENACMEVVRETELQSSKASMRGLKLLFSPDDGIKPQPKHNNAENNVGVSPYDRAAETIKYEQKVFPHDTIALQDQSINVGYDPTWAPSLSKYYPLYPKKADEGITTNPCPAVDPNCVQHLKSITTHDFWHNLGCTTFLIGAFMHCGDNQDANLNSQIQNNDNEIKAINSTLITSMNAIDTNSEEIASLADTTERSIRAINGSVKELLTLLDQESDAMNATDETVGRLIVGLKRTTLILGSLIAAIPKHSVDYIMLDYLNILAVQSQEGMDLGQETATVFTRVLSPQDNRLPIEDSILADVTIYDTIDQDKTLTSTTEAATGGDMMAGPTHQITAALKFKVFMDVDYSETEFNAMCYPYSLCLHAEKKCMDGGGSAMRMIFNNLTKTVRYSPDCPMNSISQICIHNTPTSSPMHTFLDYDEVAPFRVLGETHVVAQKPGVTIAMENQYHPLNPGTVAKLTSGSSHELSVCYNSVCHEFTTVFTDEFSVEDASSGAINGILEYIEGDELSLNATDTPTFDSQKFRQASDKILTDFYNKLPDRSEFSDIKRTENESISKVKASMTRFLDTTANWSHRADQLEADFQSGRSFQHTSSWMGIVALALSIVALLICIYLLTKSDPLPNTSNYRVQPIVLNNEGPSSQDEMDERHSRGHMTTVHIIAVIAAIIPPIHAGNIVETSSGSILMVLSLFHPFGSSKMIFFMCIGYAHCLSTKGIAGIAGVSSSVFVVMVVIIALLLHYRSPNREFKLVQSRFRMCFHIMNQYWGIESEEYLPFIFRSGKKPELILGIQNTDKKKMIVFWYRMCLSGRWCRLIVKGLDQSRPCVFSLINIIGRESSRTVESKIPIFRTLGDPTCQYQMQVLLVNAEKLMDINKEVTMRDVFHECTKFLSNFEVQNLLSFIINIKVHNIFASHFTSKEHGVKDTDMTFLRQVSIKDAMTVCGIDELCKRVSAACIRQGEESDIFKSDFQMTKAKRSEVDAYKKLVV